MIAKGEVIRDGTKLTREEIHVMEAGEVMDRFVAWAVMGWAIAQVVDSIQGWRPSTEIASAWKVVEALRAQRRDLVLNDGTYQPITYEVQAGYDAHGPWTFCCFALDGGIDSRSARAMTAPLAICRAALLTTLSEEEYAEGRRWIDGTKVENGRLVMPT